MLKLDHKVYWIQCDDFPNNNKNWNWVNSSKEKGDPIPALSDKNETITDDLVKAELFTSYFYSALQRKI